MRIVIDIPESLYRFYKTNIDSGKLKVEEDILGRLLNDGIILPNGHGDLIDRDTIHLGIEKFHSKGDWETANWEVQFAEVVIPADKGE